MSYLDKPLPIHKLTFGPTIRNISKPEYYGSVLRYKSVLKKPFYSKMRKVDIDLILGKPTWVDNIKDTFKNLHTTDIMDQLWRLSSNSTYGIGWTGIGYPYSAVANALHTEDLNELYERRRAADLRIKQYLHNRPSGRFMMTCNRSIIYPGFKYHCIEDYGDIKEISSFEDEEMTVKNL